MNTGKKYGLHGTSSHRSTRESLLDHQVISKKSLPIDGLQRALLYLLDKNDVVIVIGETGCGKSTRIPQILISSGVYNSNVDANPDSVPKRSFKKQICVTEPRRMAAVQLARRVSMEVGCKLGETIGYTIRFDDESSEAKTKVKFVTEGIIMNEIMSDPLLERYSVIMVDEVHERNIQCDILLGLLRCVIKKRHDLKLILCSATMNVDMMKKFFSFSESAVDSTRRVGLLRVPGKTFPVKIYNSNQPVHDYVEATAETIIEIHEKNRLSTGKILAFVTGQDEVEYICDRLNDYAQSCKERIDLKKLVLLPLYSSLSPDELDRIYQDYGRNYRICIIATNVAETSITIDDIAFVIDCGFTKIKNFNPISVINQLIRVPISKSSAEQRAGRTGRTREGAVYRLYPTSEYDKLAEDNIPEIQRICMMETIMKLKSLGVKKPQCFPLITPIPIKNYKIGMILLDALGALDNDGQLSDDGYLMADMNIDPKLARILINSPNWSCSNEMCKIIAMLLVKEIYHKPHKNFKPPSSNESLAKICVVDGDLITYLNILNGFLAADKSRKWADRRSLNYQALLSAADLTIKLQSILKKKGIELKSTNRVEQLQRCIISGLFPNAAQLGANGDYKTIRGDLLVHIHPLSVYADLRDLPKLVVFGDILSTTKLYMRHLMAVDKISWLLDAAPKYYVFATEMEMMRNR